MTKQSTLAQYFEASLLGAGRGFLSLLVEHPFDAIKTCHQGDLQAKNIFETTKNIFSKHGWRGYYTGFIPNGIRLSGKQMYRWPMMLALPNFYRTNLSENFKQKYPSSVKTLTGLSIACFETFIISPLERLKVLLMTEDIKGKNLQRFFSQNKNRLFLELSRGFSATFLRQVMSWTSFLVADEKFKQRERRLQNVENLSFSSLLKVSCYVGIVNVLTNMPFDVIKTNLQKKYYYNSFFKTLQKIYNLHGIKGLFRGWQVRLVQYTIQSLFTVTLLDHLETKWKKN